MGIHVSDFFFFIPPFPSPLPFHRLVSLPVISPLTGRGVGGVVKVYFGSGYTAISINVTDTVWDVGVSACAAAKKELEIHLHLYINIYKNNIHLHLPLPLHIYIQIHHIYII